MTHLALDLAAIAQAARLLEQGRLVALPTETVYGLGADAENPDAVARIYQAKGRPQDHPVIVHVAPGADLGYWATDIPAEAQQLAAAFWPGPLTMILKRRPEHSGRRLGRPGYGRPALPLAPGRHRAAASFQGRQGRGGRTLGQ